MNDPTPPLRCDRPMCLTCGHTVSTMTVHVDRVRNHVTVSVECHGEIMLLPMVVEDAAKITAIEVPPLFRPIAVGRLVW